MKTLRTIKLLFVCISIACLSACELVEEPNFDETEETGNEYTEEYATE